MGNKTGIQWTDATWNPLRGCSRVSKGCENCLGPDTPVLMSDMSWVPIGEIKEGDKVIAFTDNPKVGQNRVFEEATVVKTWKTRKEAVELYFGSNTIVSSVDHLFLSPHRPYWRKAEKINLNTKISSIGFPKWLPDINSKPYLAGYIAGVVGGDDTIRIEGSGKNGTLQSYCRVAVLATDKPILERLKKALIEFGCKNINIRSFNGGDAFLYREANLPMLKIETRIMDNLLKIRNIIIREESDFNWKAGFLAGFLDMDGCYSGKNLRFNQTKENNLLNIAHRAIADLGFKSKYEQYSTQVNKSEILLGTISDKIQFLSTIQPALQRKTVDFHGRRFPSKQSIKFDGIRRIGKRNLVDIQTTSGTFIALGMAVHNCYAETVAHRFSGPGEPYHGLIAVGKKGPRWNGNIMLVPDKLADPIRWTKPRMVFVNSMSDLFHHGVANEYIAAVFGVMAAAQKHTFQVLTKRPERAKDWFDWVALQVPSPAEYCANEARKLTGRKETDKVDKTWPLNNVWLGVSCEDQSTADKRIPILLRTTSKVRWASYEPALAPVDFSPWVNDLDWIVVGGESGSGARAFDWIWADNVVKCVNGTSTKVFVKQLGSKPILTGLTMSKLNSKKGDDPVEWPKSIQIREYPV